MNLSLVWRDRIDLSRDDVIEVSHDMLGGVFSF